MSNTAVFDPFSEDRLPGITRDQYIEIASMDRTGPRADVSSSSVTKLLVVENENFYNYHAHTLVVPLESLQAFGSFTDDISFLNYEPTQDTNAIRLLQVILGTGNADLERIHASLSYREDNSYSLRDVAYAPHLTRLLPRLILKLVKKYIDKTLKIVEVYGDYSETHLITWAGDMFIDVTNIDELFGSLGGGTIQDRVLGGFNHLPLFSQEYTLSNGRLILNKTDLYFSRYGNPNLVVPMFMRADHATTTSFNLDWDSFDDLALNKEFNRHEEALKPLSLSNSTLFPNGYDASVLDQLPELGFLLQDVSGHVHIVSIPKNVAENLLIGTHYLADGSIDPNPSVVLPSSEVEGHTHMVTISVVDDHIVVTAVSTDNTHTHSTLRHDLFTYDTHIGAQDLSTRKSILNRVLNQTSTHFRIEVNGENHVHYAYIAKDDVASLVAGTTSLVEVLTTYTYYEGLHQHVLEVTLVNSTLVVTQQLAAHTHTDIAVVDKAVTSFVTTTTHHRTTNVASTLMFTNGVFDNFQKEL